MSDARHSYARILTTLVITCFVAAFTAQPGAAQTAKNLKCNGCVNSKDIKNNNVKSVDIKNGQVKNADLGTNAVTGNKIAPGAVGNSDLGSNAVTSAKIAPGAVGTEEIEDAGVITDKIADGAVTAPKLAADVRTNPATPISDCTTIDQPGSYIVTQNITAVGTCLNVSANLVTIDLGGFVLTGDGTGNGINAGGMNRQSVNVRNGTITNFFNGMDLSVTPDSIVQGVTVIDNAGIGIAITAGCIVTGNIASRNGIDGIRVFVPGECTVTGNTANDNGSSGLNIACPSNVIGNTAIDNPGGNLSLSGGICNDIDNLAP